MKRIGCILALFFCLAVSTFAGERQSATVIRVIDGDTLRVWDGEMEATVRLLGIDTPEMHPNRKAEIDAREWGVSVEDIIRAGRRARNFTSSIALTGIGFKGIELEADGEDAYGRTLAYVYLPDGRCLNKLIIQYGCGLAPERYRHALREDFAELEREAREKKRGFWKTVWANF